MRHRGQEPPTAAQLEQLELPSSSARCLSNQLSNNADENQHSPMDPSGRISRVEDVISRVDDSVRDEEANVRTRHKYEVRVRSVAESRLIGSRRLRCAQPRPATLAPGCGPGGPTRHGGPGDEVSIHRSDRHTDITDTWLREAHLPRLVSVPVAATRSRAPAASHAIASRPLTRRPLIRDWAPTRKMGEEQGGQGRQR